MIPVRAGIVGLGWWGRVLVEAADGSDALVFTRCADAAGQSVAAVAAQYGFPAVERFEDLLGDNDIDAIVLATPHSAHVEQIIACAEAGKAVYCEKPLALELESAERAVAACRRTGVVLGLGNDKRLLPAIIELTRMTRSGELGRLLHLEGQYSNDSSSRGLSGAWRADPVETPAGGLSGPGLHVLDGMVALAGPVAEASALTFALEGETVPFDSLAAALRFARGPSGVLATVRGVPDYFRLSVFGTAGWAEVTGFGTLTTATGGAEPIVRSFSADLAAGDMLEAFALAVRRVAPFPVSETSMLQTVAAFEAIVHSVRRGQPARANRVAART